MVIFTLRFKCLYETEQTNVECSYSNFSGRNILLFITHTKRNQIKLLDVNMETYSVHVNGDIILFVILFKLVNFVGM